MTVEGHFNGQFSNIANAHGDPRLMTGVFLGDFGEADGAFGQFLDITTAIAQRP